MSRKHWDVYLTCSLLRLIIPESSMSRPLEMLLSLLLCGSEEAQSARVHRDFVIGTPRVSCSSLSSSYRGWRVWEAGGGDSHQHSHPEEESETLLDSRPHARDVNRGTCARSTRISLRARASAPFNISINISRSLSLSLSVVHSYHPLFLSGMLKG